MIAYHFGEGCTLTIFETNLDGTIFFFIHDIVTLDNIFFFFISI